MKLLRKLLASSLALIALPSLAVSFSTPVSDEEYQNHEVHFLIKGSDPDARMKTCSGMLMGGKYLLTAGHCLDGDAAELTIFQGPERLVPFASHLRTGKSYKPFRSYDANLAWNYYMRDLWEQWIYPATPDAYLTEGWHTAQSYTDRYRGGVEWLLAMSEDDRNNPMNHSHNDNDFGILVLNEAVPHHSSRIVSPLIDIQTGNAHLTENDEFTFRGFGYQNRSPVKVADYQMQGTFRMYRPYLRSHALVSNGFPAIGEDRLDMCVETSPECYLRPQSLIDLVGIDTGLGFPASLPGDSGAAIVFGDHYFGSMYGGDRDPIDGRYISVFSDVSYLMDWIGDIIQEVTYPSDIGVTIREGDHSVHEIKVPIQNFTKEVLLVYTASVEGDGFSIIEDCGGVLMPTKGCMMTVLFNVNEMPVDEEVTSTIDLGVAGARSLPISVRFMAEVEPDLPEVPDISCDDDPWYPGCYDICDLDWYADGCPPVECSVDPYQDKCLTSCEWNPNADNCSVSAPDETENSEATGSSGSSDSGGSGSFGVLMLLAGLTLRRRMP